MVKKKQVTKTKTKKKTWFPISSPAVFGTRGIGETYVLDPAAVVGRKLRVNLKDLTGSVRDQHVYVRFKVVGKENSALQTTVIGYELAPAYVKRMVRKNADRIDGVVSIKSKEGEEVVLKMMITTLGKTQRSVRTALRAGLVSILKSELGRGDFSSFVGQIVNSRIRLNWKKALSKVYPVRDVAIRSMKV